VDHINAKNVLGDFAIQPLRRSSRRAVSIRPILFRRSDRKESSSSPAFKIAKQEGQHNATPLYGSLPPIRSIGLITRLSVSAPHLVHFIAFIPAAYHHLSASILLPMAWLSLSRFARLGPRNPPWNHSQHGAGPSMTHRPGAHRAVRVGQRCQVLRLHHRGGGGYPCVDDLLIRTPLPDA
jgi:hypothetical protein